MIIFILEYLFMFLTGSIIGWCLEVVYRRYFGLARKWINPGFLSGPYLPLYGTGVCLLYIICNITMPLPLRILLFAFVTTAIEYATGVFFLKKYKVRLWDYSESKFNFQGHITPLYTFFWTLLSLIFYYIMYPYFYQKVESLYAHLEFSLLIGIFYGVVLVDIINSFHILNRLMTIKDALGEKAAVINFEKLKDEMAMHIDEIQYKVEELQDRVEEFGNKVSGKVDALIDKGKRAPFFLPFKKKDYLKTYIKDHINKI